MNFRATVERCLSVSMRSAAAESVSQPKFCLVPGGELSDEFALTRQALEVLRFYIATEACACLRRRSAEAGRLWRLMGRVSRECFWSNNAHALRVSSTPFFVPDLPLCFESLGLLLLDLTPGCSFLHINSGRGYACTLAAVLVGPNCLNHGVEFQPSLRIVARDNIICVQRYHPDFRDRNSFPLFHARHPADLLQGRAKFDRILVTECFMNIQEAVDLKSLLNPGGRLVTGYLRDSDEEVGMAVVTRGEQEWDVAIERVDDEWMGPSLQLHPLKGENLGELLFTVLGADNKTTAKLAVCRRYPAAPPDSALTSLENLSMEACNKMADPIARLLGDLRHEFLIRVSSRYPHLPYLSAPLKNVIDALNALRTRCLAIHEDSFDAEDLQEATNALGDLVVAFEGLGRQFVGQDRFSLWKEGHETALCVPRAVMIWLVENVFHVVRFSGVDHQRCCFVAEKSKFDSCFPPDDALTDSDRNISVPRPLLDAVMAFFRRVDFQVLDREPPWNYQLPSAKQMRRTLTRLAARLCADASVMLKIVRAMKALCEAANGGPMSTDPVVIFNLSRCQQHLTELYGKMYSCAEFAPLDTFQDTFSQLTPHLMRMHHDACFLVARGPPTPEVLFLFTCFRLLDSSALRNLVGTGRVQQCSAPAQLEWVNGAGGLLDSGLFHAERAFLSSGPLQESITPEQVCDFLVRRLMSDLKEALWMAEGVVSDKKLAMLEQNLRMHHMSVLHMFDPKPMTVNLLRGMA